jgi:hypothetical protein
MGQMDTPRRLTAHRNYPAPINILTQPPQMHQRGNLGSAEATRVGAGREEAPPRSM